MRRGKRAANLIWGNPASVLVGDFLFSRAFELMVEDGSLKVLKILSHASAVIAEGEVEQLTAQREIETDDPELVPAGPWLEWHFERFCTPPGATELARTAEAFFRS